MIYGFNDNKEKVDVDELLEESSPSVKPDISRVHAPETVYFAKEGEDPNELFGGFWVEDTHDIIGVEDEVVPEYYTPGKKYIKTKGVEAYAVYDSDTFTLTFFRDEEDKYTNGQEIGSKTYYTGVESTSGLSTVPWRYIVNSCKKVIFADHILPTCTAYWFHHPYHYDSDIESIEHLERLHTQNVTSMYGMFWKCSSLSDIQCQYFDTSNVTSMGNMFSSCSSLENVLIKEWDTSNVRNMSGMFQYCTMINNVFIHGDTSNVTDMSNMFYGCERLTSISIRSMDVSNVTDMHNMFRGTKVSSLSLEFWDTSKVNTTEWMFKDCQYLSTIFVTSDWDMSSVIDDQEMFDGCTLLVGGNGTTYSSSHIESDYAKIDESGSPGYLTESVAYARWDNGSNKELSFFRAAAGTYTNGQVSSNYTYWTDIETSVYTSASECPWYSKRSSVKTCSINGKIRPISTAYWFYDMTGSGFKKFQSIRNTYYIDTRNTTNMEYMFYNCTYLSSIQMFNLDTSKVTDMSYMFGNCTRLTHIQILNIYPRQNTYRLGDIICWDTSNVKDMKYMFYNCNRLGYLNLSSWDTFNVANTESMFRDCYRMYTIYVSDKWNTDSITSSADSADMFSGCQYLTGGWGTRFDSLYKDKTYARIDDPQANRPGYLTYLPGPAKEAYAVYDSSDTSLTFFRDDIGKYTNGQVDGTKTYYTGIESTGRANPPWYSNRADVTTVIFKDVIKPISCYEWFYGMENLIDIVDLKYLNTSNVTDMKLMFYNCNSITTLDVSHFDTHNVTDMQSMFYMSYRHGSTPASELTTLDVSHFDTSNVTKMGYMFASCGRLTNIDVSNFDTSNVTDMQYMFAGCCSLTTLDLSLFNTSKVTNMACMFSYCIVLSTLDLSHFDTSRLTTTPGMFEDAYKLSINKFNIMHMPTSYDRMFDDAATDSNALINIYYISPATSANIDTLIATKGSNSNVVNAGPGTFVSPGHSSEISE